jgi:hypothetical protein
MDRHFRHDISNMVAVQELDAGIGAARVVDEAPSQIEPATGARDLLVLQVVRNWRFHCSSYRGRACWGLRIGPNAEAVASNGTQNVVVLLQGKATIYKSDELLQASYSMCISRFRPKPF